MGDLGGPWVPSLLLAAALAGCLAPSTGPGPDPGSAQDDGPPYVVTVETRYVPDGARNVSGPDRGGINRFDAARLPDGTVATHPMWIAVSVGEPSALHGGRAQEEARTGWAYDDDPCRHWRPHATHRINDNRCDEASVRPRHVLPPLYPQDRAENYSWHERMGWHGRGYVYSTANDSDESKPWNYTKGVSGSMPLDTSGSVQLVFRHRVPIPISVGGPAGEIPEWMDEEVIEPENCTSDADERYDYVFASDGHVAELHGGVERDPDGRGLMLHGDGRVVLEWSVLCRRDKNHIQY